MRITFILPTVNMSGGTKVVAIYAKELVGRGHHVTLVSPPPEPLSLRSKVKLFVNGRPLSAPPAKSHLDGLNLDHRVLESPRPPVDSDVPDSDVLVATWWQTAEWVNAISPHKGAKCYFIQHHEVFSYLPVQRCHATYRLPMHKIVVARWLKEVMQNQYADPVVDVVPNSVDRSQFFSRIREKQPVPTVGFLYSSAAWKGVEISLAAIQGVRQQIPKLRVICFGAERPTSMLPASAGAEFFFSPAQDEIRNLYSQCDVWLTASRSEGFNLPAMEAMACRTPIVATKTGWPEEAITTGENGVLVDVDDVASLARGLNWVLSLSNNAWKELSQRAYDTACVGSWAESSLTFERALLHACRRSLAGEISGKCGCAV